MGQGLGSRAPSVHRRVQEFLLHPKSWHSVGLGLHRDYTTGLYGVLYRGYIGILEKKMETTMLLIRIPG